MTVYGYKKKKSKQELLRAVDRCRTISQLFDLVRQEEINMSMHTLPGASNIPPKRLEIRNLDPGASPLDRLKAAVRMTVELTNTNLR